MHGSVPVSPSRCDEAAGLAALHDAIGRLGFVRDAAEASVRRLALLEERCWAQTEENAALKRSLQGTISDTIARVAEEDGASPTAYASDAGRSSGTAPWSKRLLRSKVLLEREARAVRSVRRELHVAVAERATRSQAVAQRENRLLSARRDLHRQRSALVERRSARSLAMVAHGERRQRALRIRAAAAQCRADCVELRAELREKELAVVEGRAQLRGQKESHDAALSAALAQDERKRALGSDAGALHSRIDSGASEAIARRHGLYVEFTRHGVEAPGLHRDLTPRY